MTLKSEPYRQGMLAEERAFSYLKEKGLQALDRNYRTHRGEIDIIMQDKETVVFVEVRARTNNYTMDILETIDHRKRSRIILASHHYLQKTKRTNKSICRFDVVLLTGPPESAKIDWIKNAFEA